MPGPLTQVVSINPCACRKTDSCVSGGNAGLSLATHPGSGAICPTLHALASLASPALNRVQSSPELWNLPHTPRFGIAPGAPALGGPTEIWEEVPGPEKHQLRDKSPSPGPRPCQPPPCPVLTEGCNRLGSAHGAQQSGRQAQACGHLPWADRAGKFTKVSRAASSSSFFPGEVDESIPSRMGGPLASGRLSTPSHDSTNLDTEPGNCHLPEAPGKKHTQPRGEVIIQGYKGNS